MQNFNYIPITPGSLNSAVSIATRSWTAEKSDFESQKSKIFLLSTSSRPVLGPAQRLFPEEYSGRDVKLSNHLQLVSRSIMCGSIHALPHVFMVWCLII
jgi:hypothetical protein